MLINENNMKKLFGVFELYWAKTIQYLHGTSIRNSFVSPYSRVALECNIISCKIDKFSYVGRISCIINTEIGKFCSIADNVYIGGAEYPMILVSNHLYSRMLNMLVQRNLLLNSSGILIKKDPYRK